MVERVLDMAAAAVRHGSAMARKRPHLAAEVGVWRAGHSALQPTGTIWGFDGAVIFETNSELQRSVFPSIAVQAQCFTVESILSGIHYFRIQDSTEQVALVNMLDHLLTAIPEVRQATCYRLASELWSVKLRQWIRCILRSMHGAPLRISNTLPYPSAHRSASLSSTALRSTSVRTSRTWRTVPVC